jgi:hypothetical protein
MHVVAILLLVFLFFLFGGLISFNQGPSLLLVDLVRDPLDGDLLLALQGSFHKPWSCSSHSYTVAVPAARPLTSAAPELLTATWTQRDAVGDGSVDL